ncbi:MBL fold metallo-hydrolase [Eubacterium sp. 1001713B170207_170306_E7]|uniref:ComEC/Rec2 family competence protein n=1 Tax=Eubacterium sp. 1001713B170207_170306_E7 TaxID=2787097 RepID=UPI0018974B4F|nr:MBL fold metallo-hydrolase [Eubacterium sp. 1001713B170207_170306_E7]
MTKHKIAALLLAAAFLVFSVFGCSALKEDPGLVIDAEGTLRVHYIDVGQGDCTLIQTPDNKNILIDTGNPENYETINTYLRAQKVEKLDVMLITHPHSDHMGSAEKILKNHTVESIYLPKVAHNTQLFESFMKSVSEKGLKANAAHAGVHIPAGDALSIELFSPVEGKSYTELNDYSPITKVTYGDTSFLFTGDGEAEDEQDAVAQAGLNLKSDVLKVGHHGSDTSTGELFLSIVNPQYAVISVGRDNAYGHPNKSTMSKLKNKTVFRTDQEGNVVAISNGQGISFITQNSGTLEETTAPTAEASVTPADAAIYIGNKKTKKFHLSKCSGLPKAENQTIFETRDDAVSQGYTPCGTCRP